MKYKRKLKMGSHNYKDKRVKFRKVTEYYTETSPNAKKKTIEEILEGVIKGNKTYHNHLNELCYRVEVGEYHQWYYVKEKDIIEIQSYTDTHLGLQALDNLEEKDKNKEDDINNILRDVKKGATEFGNSMERFLELVNKSIVKSLKSLADLNINK